MRNTAKYYVSTLLLGAALSAAAVPAKPGLIPMTQPDGSVIEVRLVGDERSHYTLSSDGYLLQPVNNTYYFATIEADGTIAASAHRAAAPEARSAETRAFLSSLSLADQASRMTARDAAIASTRVYDASTSPFRAPRQASEGQQGFPMGPGLFPGTHFPPLGVQKGLVILVRYQDYDFTLDNPLDYFTRMLNEPGFSDYGATGSAVDFFTESSSGLFQPEFDVYGPITLSKNRSYYGGNNWSGDDSNPQWMAIEACQQLDDQVDFTQYDRDGDGYIDNVFIFYCGRGEASGGSADTVWPHAWNVTSATYTPYYFDGVQLDRYACSNEWESGRPDGVGTFVHEFSHVMGLPDLYATSYTSAFTPGAWSAMDYGPYNNDGMTPPLYSAFERYALGWIEPSEITGPMNATLPSIGQNVCGIVKTSSVNEYFLFENRQQTSWDTYLPGHGMLVWHVDYNSSVWNSNRVNNTPSHQYVDIEEADGTQSSYSRTGDAFPGASGVTQFTSSGTPAFRTWSGQAIDLPLTEIAESSDGVITFKVKGGREEALASTTALPASDETSGSFTANWEAVADASNYLLSVYRLSEPSLDAEATPILSLKSVGNVTSYLVEGLEPETAYAYEVCVGGGLEYSAPSNRVITSTGLLPLGLRTPVVLDATDVTETSFTANWLPMEGADSYMVSLYEKVWGASFEATAGFDGGAKDLPSGWVSSSQAGYANAAYSGTAIPSLRFSTSGDFILSTAFDDDIHAVSFWHRGSAASSPEDMLNVLVRIDGKWLKVASFPVVTQTGGIVYTADEIPEGAREARIEYIRVSPKGAVAIDDVTVFWGMTFSHETVEAYPEPVAAADATSLCFPLLEAGTTYSYSVTALGPDDAVSRPSALMDVTTEGTRSALSSVAAEAATYAFYGSALTAFAPVEIYSLAGIKVAAVAAGQSVALPAGIYIVKSQNAASKIVSRAGR